MCIKILHIINDLSGGGAESLLKETLKVMKRKNVQVEVLLLSERNNVFLDELTNNDIKVHFSYRKSIYSPFHIWKIRSLINKYKYDIIHTHLFPAFYWGALASKILAVKPILITTEHTTVNKRRNKKQLKFIEDIIYKEYSKVFCISKSVEKNLINWLPNTQNKTTVIHNGIDVIKYKNALKLEPKSICPTYQNGDKLIVMVARMSYEKDQYTLINSLKYLSSKYKLILVGDGPLLIKYKDLVKELGFEERVFFLGFRNDVPNIIKTCDIFVLSSNIEGFGLVVIEAMATGKPVLASDIDGVREILGFRELAFKPKDPQMLAKKTQNILEDNDYYEYLARECESHSALFSIGAMVDKFLNEYESMLKETN